MAVHPLHRLSGVEWKVTSKRMIEGDSKRVEVAPRIDRTIHPPGLLRGHVRQRSGDVLGRFDYLALAWKAQRETKPCEACITTVRIDENVGGLDVLVYEPAPMQARHGAGHSNGQLQERPDRKVLTDQLVERPGRCRLEH